MGGGGVHLFKKLFCNINILLLSCAKKALIKHLILSFCMKINKRLQKLND